ncbi:MAG: 4-(cytidine 5'-diphospho)-2-C-methyl-D-erythritol kinase [Clostridia bacterium]|nr:4-(cytidine 5'-diphospho)-2-C-methyl-D-erythritol kinase [Clostridia bacterium]
MNSYMVAAPAKINLYLDVTSRREDGYHEILSIMQTVSLCDEIFLERVDSEGIELICDDPALPADSKNIAYRAAELFLKHACINCGIRISLRKTIPAAAGLAGGSADASAVLRGLNAMFGKPFSIDGLCGMAAALGADVPFCVRGGCMKAEGIGEKLSPLPCMPDCSIVISCPDARVSTPAAYAALDAMYGDFKYHQQDDSRYWRAEAALCSDSLDGVCQNMYNIFESVQHDRKDIAELKNVMTSAGALATMMSGSGPSVFGVFSNSNDAAMASLLIEKHGYTAYICAPTKSFAI